MSGVSIRYGDITVGARENFAPFSDDKTFFSNLDNFKIDRLSFQNYSNPIDYYSTPLDGNGVGLLEEESIISLWSDSVSDENGNFENPIHLVLQSTQKYATNGLTLTFDSFNDVYANNLLISFYDGDTLLSEQSFTPNSAKFYCEKNASHKEDQYNKIIFTFYSVNIPYGRLKLNEIEYGAGINIKGRELRNVKLIQEINPISTDISINTCDFLLDSKSDYDFKFKTKQPLEIYFNGELKATTFVKNAKRVSKKMYQVESEDYIGLLDTVPFYGGLYREQSGASILEEIFDTAKVPYQIDYSADSNLSGYIPYGTCREALMQVCFALGVVADTSNSGYIKIYPLSDDVTQSIPRKRIMQGQNFEEKTKVTRVELSAHGYVKTTEQTVAYDAEQSGTGKGILVVFNEPLHDLSISNNGQIIKYGDNYAIINANDGSVLVGKKYNHTTTTKGIDNPDASASDVSNVVSIASGTLVSNANIDKILGMCYNYITSESTINLKIIEGKHEEKSITYYGEKAYGTFLYGSGLSRKSTNDTPVSVGEKITTETEYLGYLIGRVIKQTFNLNGGVIIKDTVMVQS